MSAAVSRATARRVRVKVVASIFTTYGYTLIGAVAIQPLLTGSAKLNVIQIAVGVAGLASHAYAIYIAPYGEPP